MAMIPLREGQHVNAASVVALKVTVDNRDHDAVVEVRLTTGRTLTWRYPMDVYARDRYLEQAEEQRVILHVLLTEYGVPLLQVNDKLFVHPAHVHTVEYEGKSVLVRYGPGNHSGWWYGPESDAAATFAAELIERIDALT